MKNIIEGLLFVVGDEGLTLEEINNILEQNIVFKITMSFGITEYEENKNIERAIQEADIALYSSKINGKNKITNYKDYYCSKYMIYK